MAVVDWHPSKGGGGRVEFSFFEWCTDSHRRIFTLWTSLENPLPVPDTGNASQKKGIDMAGFILDAQLHALARHLVKVDNRVDIEKEIKYLNDHYQFVAEEDFSDFQGDLYSLYQFERDRKMSALNKISYARFKLDQLTGSASLESHDAELDSHLQGVRL